MDDKVLKYLYDILQSIENVDAYVGEPKIFDVYNSNPMMQDAVERNIAIIGEAVNSILKIEETVHISNARKIVGTRNRLIHGYDDIDNVEVWNIIVNDLPKLKSQVLHLLSL